MGRRSIGLALASALGLLVGLVAWSGGRSGARAIRAEDASSAPSSVAAGELLAAAAPADAPERTPLAPETDALEPVHARAAPVELGPREGLLQVRVVALETKEPVPGARVRLETPAGAPLALPARTTDAAGRVDFRAPAGEPLLVHARFDLDGGRSARLAVRPLDPRQYRTTIVGVYAEPDRTLRALVLDGASGLPIQGARIGIESGFAASLFSALTEADGRACVALREDAGALAVEADGYGRLVLDAWRDVPRDAELQVELFQTATLRVLVRGTSGAPVVGARVAVWQVVGEAGGDARFGEAWSATTDLAGRAELAGLLARTHLVAAVLGDGLARVERLVLGPDEELSLVWTLAERGRVAGSVRDLSGAPVAEARVVLVPVDPASTGLPSDVPRELLLECVTDADGGFRLDDVPPGAWRIGEPAREPAYRGGIVVDGDGVLRALRPSESDVTAASAALEARRIVVAPGESLTADLRAWRGLAIRGRLVGHASVGGLAVTARGAELSAHALASDTGAFVLGPLVPGEYVLTTRFPGGKFGETRAVAGATGIEIRPLW